MSVHFGDATSVYYICETEGYISEVSTQMLYRFIILFETSVLMIRMGYVCRLTIAQKQSRSDQQAIDCSGMSSETKFPLSAVPFPTVM